MNSGPINAALKSLGRPTFGTIEENPEQDLVETGLSQLRMKLAESSAQVLQLSGEVEVRGEQLRVHDVYFFADR